MTTRGQMWPLQREVERCETRVVEKEVREPLVRARARGCGELHAQEKGPHETVAWL
jgi:hypothetical protein